MERPGLLEAASRCAAIVLLCVSGFAAGQEQAADSTTPAEVSNAPDAAATNGDAGEVAAVREGRALFASHQCWQCHGYEGQGSVAGVRIAPTLYPFEAFSRLVRYTNIMPAYSPNVLSEEQLRLIYAYVSSIPEPPPLEDIPGLDFD